MNEVYLSEPVLIRFMPAQVELVLRGLGELPFKMSQPLIESILNQCRDQSEKKDEPA